MQKEFEGTQKGKPSYLMIASHPYHLCTKSSFSDIGNNRRLKWAPGEGVSVFHEPSNNAKGLTRDPLGRLIACEHGTRV